MRFETVEQTLITCMKGKLSVLLVVGAILPVLLVFQRAYAPQMVRDWSRSALWEKFEHESVRLLMQDRLHSLKQQLTSTYQFNGSILVAHKGLPLLSWSHGVANIRNDQPLSTNSAFQLASVSKMFTATAVMLLADEGLLQIDDPVHHHIPEWPYHDQTIRHLLTHRSGLSRYMAVASWYWKDPKQPLHNDDVIRQYADHAPITFFTPDHRFNYCNSNYVVLAELVERVSGVPYDELLQEKIFDRLGMSDAFVYTKGDRTMVPEVIGYKPGRGRYYPAWQDYIDGVWGDKNVYASINDMQKFDRAIREGRLVSPESMTEMWIPGSPDRTYNYGFGWRLRVTDEETIPYHFGWWRGFRTCYIHDPKTGLTLIMLNNLDDSSRIPGYWELFFELRKSWPTAPVS